MEPADRADDRPRFAVDGMLEKLASYLRCMGFDASFEPRRSTAARVESASPGGRVILTRNRRLEHVRPLPERRQRLGRHRLGSEDRVEQLGRCGARPGRAPRGSGSGA